MKDSSPLLSPDDTPRCPFSSMTVRPGDPLSLPPNFQVRPRPMGHGRCSPLWGKARWSSSALLFTPLPPGELFTELLDALEMCRLECGLTLLVRHPALECGLTLLLDHVRLLPPAASGCAL